MQKMQEMHQRVLRQRGLIAVDSLGMMPLCLTIVLGLIIGLIKIPLPGGAFFSLGTSGGPLIAGLLIGHIVHIGPIDLKPKKSVMECMREFGLILFLIGAGCEGGAGFVDTLYRTRSDSFRVRNDNDTCSDDCRLLICKEGIKASDPQQHGCLVRWYDKYTSTWLTDSGSRNG